MKQENKPNLTTTFKGALTALLFYSITVLIYVIFDHMRYDSREIN